MGAKRSHSGSRVAETAVVPTMTKEKLLKRLNHPFRLVWERDRVAASPRKALSNESANNLANPHVRQLDVVSFEQTIQHGIVLVDFDEPRCAPCRTHLAVLENLANQIDSETTLAEVNIDAAPVLASYYRVERLPTLLLFKDGQLLDRFVGVQREPRLALAIKAAASE